MTLYPGMLVMWQFSFMRQPHFGRVLEIRTSEFAKTICGNPYKAEIEKEDGSTEWFFAVDLHKVDPGFMKQYWVGKNRRAA